MRERWNSPHEISAFTTTADGRASALRDRPAYREKVMR